MKIPRLVGLSSALVAGLLVSGSCGGDTSSSSDSEQNSTEPTTSAASSLTPAQTACIDSWNQDETVLRTASIQGVFNSSVEGVRVEAAPGTGECVVMIFSGGQGYGFHEIGVSPGIRAWSNIPGPTDPEIERLLGELAAKARREPNASIDPDSGELAALEGEPTASTAASNAEDGSTQSGDPVGLAVTALEEQGVSVDSTGAMVLPSEVDPSWILVSGSADDPWAVWIEDGEVRLATSPVTPEGGPPEAPCDIFYAFSESVC